ncbi:MAG: hypothetical protein KF797_06380 [Flavobacteriales bacterium]|nr:hypothetical protein [Flavobacteriales bacterium]
MRRSLVVLLLLAVCGAVAWTLFRWNRTTSAAADPWRAIPERSAAILVIPDAWTTWDRFTHTSQFWTSLEHRPTVSAMGRIMDRTAARAENDAALRSALQQVTVLAALMRTGGDHVDVLVACTPRAGEAVPIHAFAELLKVDEASLATLDKGGVIQCRPDTALPALSLCMQQGIWMLASSPSIMDEALLQLKSGRAITQELLFRDALNTLGGGADAHVLAHMERAKNALHTWWRAAVLDAQDLPAGWAALDLRARPDAFLLSGLILPDTAHAVLTALDHQGTGRNDLGRWLPVDVAAWDVHQVSDGERYLRDLGVASDSAISTLAPRLFNWVQGSVGLAQAADSSGAGRTWALFQTDDPEGAAEEIRRLCPDGRTCDTLAHRGVQLTQLPVTAALERLLGPSYAAFHRPWWSVLGDVIVFAPDPGTLRSAIDAWHDGRTLAEDARTSAWTERIASTAGRTLRWDIARYWPRIADGLKPDAAAAAKAESATWQRVGGLAVQLSPAQHGRTHITIGLEHAPVEQRSTGIHWSTPLPPGTTRKPDILRNHTNNTREVLVQDGDHRIHLLGSSGKVLWKYQLDGPIMGEVHQVDRFKNGKLQLLFNTAGRVYLIDRNGKDVGGFPIGLPEKATAPIAVFDYEGTKEYRVVVPLADGRIHNYGMDGAMTTGWETPHLNSAAQHPVRHLRIKNKDYLLAFDGDGHIRILDRRGGERERTNLDLGAGACVQAVSPGLELNGTRVIWADTSGALYEATLNGKPRPLAPPGRNTLGDLADDGMYDIVRTTGDSLIVMRGARSIVSRTFGATLAPEVCRYKLGRGTVFGVVIPEREQVTLIDDSGRELDGLPLRGTTPFSIADLDLDGTLELVTVTADGHVVAYNALPPQVSR